jgi:hypothetical protein
MSFWNDPGASFQGLFDDPWHSLENFGTTGLVPLIPYATGIVGGVVGGPGGAAAGGALGQGGVDYFSGNSEARTGKGIQNSLLGGAGKGMLASGGYNFGMGGGLDSLGSSFGNGGESSYGMLDSIGGNGGSFSGQDIFELPSSAYTPEYLNMLADYNGVDAGNASLLDRLTGNTEQGLYKQEALAKQASGQTVSDLLKKQAQQRAISQLGQSGSKMQQQNDAQQAEQNRMAQQQAIMRKGQQVDITTALLSLLQDKQQLRQPRISLI